MKQKASGWLLSLILPSLLLTGPGFFSKAQAAESCDPLDLRTEELGPPMMQGSVGWCFAYVAADLLTYASHQRISAPFLGYQYESHLDWLTFHQRQFFNSGSDLYEGGGIALAIHQGLKHSCIDHGDLSDLSDNLLQRSHLKTIADYKRFLEVQKLWVKGECLMTGAMADPDQPDFTNCRAFGKLTMGEAQKVIASSTDENIRQNMAKAEIRANCEMISLPNQTLMNRDFGILGFPINLVPAIDEALSAKAIAGISYHLRSFVTQPLTDKNDMHASSVVARQMRRGKCQYLVRNSWGANCNGYSNQVECDANDPGNFWVDRAQLERVVTAVNWLQPKVPMNTHSEE